MGEFRRCRPEECRGCDKLDICRCGCRVFSYKFGKGIFGADAECLRLRDTAD